jgi:hypothetical protein
MGALFLYATYFLTFAVAFHDLSAGGGALHAEQFDPPADLKEVSSPEVPAAGSGGRLGQCEIDASGLLSERFSFPDGRASVACTRALREKLPGRAWPELEDVLGRVPGIAGCQGLEPSEALTNLRATVCVERYLSSQEDARRTRISLLGHARDGLVNQGPGDYTRYELSLARVQQAHFLLSDVHEEANPKIEVEWLLLPMAGEESFLGVPASLEQESPPDHRASVEVRLHTLDGGLSDRWLPEGPQPGRSLELLD